jgi:hypothetical protein
MEEIKTTDELRIGDVIVFQGFTIPPKENEFMPTIPITIETIERFSSDGSLVKLSNFNYMQPKYRIKSVIRDDVRVEYTGFSDLAIALDEGQITDYTFEEILSHEAMSQDTL